MCIRDSCCDGLADAESGLGLFSPVKRTAARLVRAARRLDVPVQGPKLLQKDLRHAGAPGLAAAVAAVSGGEVPPAPPVSYTHLDVYKRQVTGFLPEVIREEVVRRLKQGPKQEV